MIGLREKYFVLFSLRRWRKPWNWWLLIEPFNGYIYKSDIKKKKLFQKPKHYTRIRRTDECGIFVHQSIKPLKTDKIFAQCSRNSLEIFSFQWRKRQLNGVMLFWTIQHIWICIVFTRWFDFQPIQCFSIQTNYYCLVRLNPTNCRLQNKNNLIARPLFIMIFINEKSSTYKLNIAVVKCLDFAAIHVPCFVSFIFWIVHLFFVCFDVLFNFQLSCNFLCMLRKCFCLVFSLITSFFALFK